jgi:Spy/CpxP family protein refolding chaperone
MKLSLLAFGVTLLASPLLAQTEQPSDSDAGASTHQNWHHGGWFFKKLNLTDAQKQQIESIMKSNRPQMKAASLAVLNAQKAVDQAIVSNPNDEATIRSLSATLESARTEQTVEKARVHAQVLKVLTPDQQQQMAQFKQKRTEHLQERINQLNQSES